MDLPSSERKSALLAILEGTRFTQTQEVSDGQKQKARLNWFSYILRLLPFRVIIFILTCICVST